jgi:hypothetical protein
LPPATAGSQLCNPQRPRGLLEPCAWTTGKHGSEGALARQRAGATRLGDDGAGQVLADAGDLRQPGDCVQRRGVRAGAGAGAGAPVRVDAPGGGYRRGCRGGPGGQAGDPLIEEGDLVQQQAGQLAVVVIEHAVQGLGQGVVPGLHPGAGQAGQHVRVALPGDHRLDHVLRRDRGQLAGHRRDLDQGAFQQLFQPLVAAGALVDQPGPGPGVIPQVPDRLRRHEAGAQQPRLGQPGQPLRVQLVGLGTAGQVPGLGRADQLHRQPARLQHEEPDPPVVACRLERHHLDPVPRQLPAQLADRAHPRLHRPHRAAPGPRPRRVRQPGAHHPGVLRHVHRGDPLMHPLVFLIIDNLRSAHRGLLSLTRRDNRGLPGGPVGGHQARNTDRRAQGNSARPSGQDPSARLLDGFASQSEPASRAARPTLPPAPPSAQRKPQPRSRSNPSPPRPAPARDFHAVATIPSRMKRLLALLKRFKHLENGQN